MADYLRGLAAIGVVRFESFVTDGHSEFVGADGHRVVSPAHHEAFVVAQESDHDAFLEQLQRHLDGETTYVEMSKGLADCGVTGWVADTSALTMTYDNQACVALLVEEVE